MEKNFGKDYHIWWKQVVFKTLIESGINDDSLIKVFPEVFSDLFHQDFFNPANYHVYSDTVETLKDLSKDYRLIIISNMDPRIGKRSSCFL